MSTNGVNDKVCPVGMHSASPDHDHGFKCSFIKYETDHNPAFVEEGADGKFYINNKLISYDAETCYWASEEEFEHLERARELKDLSAKLSKQIDDIITHRDTVYVRLVDAICVNDGDNRISYSMMDARLKVFEYIDRLDELIKNRNNELKHLQNGIARHEHLAKVVRGVVSD